MAEYLLQKINLNFKNAVNIYCRAKPADYNAKNRLTLA